MQKTILMAIATLMMFVVFTACGTTTTEIIDEGREIAEKGQNLLNDDDPPAMPDLVYGSGKVGYINPPNCLIPEESYDSGLTVNIRNAGDADAGTFVVDVEGEGIEVAGLGAGESTTLIFSSDYSEFEIFVDSGDGVEESDESNNIEMVMLPYPTPPADCTPTPAPATPTPTTMPVAYLSGSILDSSSDLPVVGAQVCVQGVQSECVSIGDTGMYELTLMPGDYTVEVTAENYNSATGSYSLMNQVSDDGTFRLVAQNPVFEALPPEAVLRGAVVAFDGGVNSVALAVGDAVEFGNSTWNFDFPDYNLKMGEASDITWIDGPNRITTINVLIPKLSETALGKSATTFLKANKLKITAIGDANQTVLVDDLMEVILSDASSTNLPYTLNFYRGEGASRQLVSTATINK